MLAKLIIFFVTNKEKTKKTKKKGKSVKTSAPVRFIVLKIHTFPNVSAKVRIFLQTTK